MVLVIEGIAGSNLEKNWLTVVVICAFFSFFYRPTNISSFKRATSKTIIISSPPPKSKFEPPKTHRKFFLSLISPLKLNPRP